jgi:DNA-binding MarR family transcriptional regulator
MHGQFDSRPALVGLVDEVIRLGGRLKSVFADARREAGLGDSDFTVLNAVVEAERPPTVPQIGRSLGRPRQIIQRAANALEAAGYIRTVPNPDHKRAVLLVAEEKGIAVKREADARADEMAALLGERLDLAEVMAATGALRAIRRQLEARLRAGEI